MHWGHAVWNRGLFSQDKNHFFTLAERSAESLHCLMADQVVMSAVLGEFPTSHGFLPSREFRVLRAASLSLWFPSSTRSCTKSNTSSHVAMVMGSSASAAGSRRRLRQRTIFTSPCISDCLAGLTINSGPLGTRKDNSYK